MFAVVRLSATPCVFVNYSYTGLIHQYGIQQYRLLIRVFVHLSADWQLWLVAEWRYLVNVVKAYY